MPRNSWARAASILGFVDARLAAPIPFNFIEQPQYERFVAKLRDKLGQDRLSEIMRAGAAFAEYRAVELVQEL